jgi:hypothetical protein
MPGRHDRSGYCCGDSALDRWLREDATEAGERGGVRVEVASTGNPVVGCYRLSSFQVEAGGPIKRFGPVRQPLPAILLSRLGSTPKGNRAPRRRLILAAAAVLLLIVAVAAGTLWLRRPAPTVPAAPQGLGASPGITLVVDAGGSNLTAVRPDHTLPNYPSARDIVHPVAGGWTLGWRVDGNTMITDGVDPQGLACRATGPWRAESEGVIVYDTAVLEGPGCTGTSLPPATSTRLSPASDTGRNLTETGSDLALPVIDPVQLNGVWLLRGTGLLLASDEVTNNGGGYLLDDDGDIDRAPDAQGKLTVSPDGLVTLTSPVCADAKLGHPVLHGTAALQLPHHDRGRQPVRLVRRQPC